MPDALRSERITLELGHDDEGPWSCTLTLFVAEGDGATRGCLGRRDGAQSQDAPSGRGDLVLYLHGWSDYFFHEHVAEFFVSRGFDFCALDLRKYGPSLRPGQTPTAIDSLSEYAVEIEAAIVESNRRRRAPEGGRTLLYGHSTGALTAALYARAHPEKVSGLIMNSPWLETHGGPLVRTLVSPALRGRARRRPYARALPPGHDFYARANRKDFGGEWDWVEEYKPARGHPFPANTLAAVMEGQARLARGLDLPHPILVLTSTRSAFQLRWHPKLGLRDTVLSVRGIWAAARKLGPHVRVVKIPGATHDIALSRLPVRRQFFAEIERWLREEWAGQRRET